MNLCDDLDHLIDSNALKTRWLPIEGRREPDALREAAQGRLVELVHEGFDILEGAPDDPAAERFAALVTWVRGYLAKQKRLLALEMAPLAELWAGFAAERDQFDARRRDLERELDREIAREIERELGEDEDDAP